MQWAMCSPRNISYYNMKCVMWIVKDERVELEEAVLNFGSTQSPWPTMMSQRIERMRMCGNI